MPPSNSSLEALEKKRLEAMLGSEKAVHLRPDVYARIKETLGNIVFKPLDISEYYQTAADLARCLSDLHEIGGVTIFEYYCINIDPARQGDVRYFRAVCCDLVEQIDALDKWRMTRRNIRVVK